MIFAAKGLALAGWDLFTKPELLVRAKEDLNEASGGKAYTSPLPSGLKPS